ncbi:MAG: alpha/beta hydrolase [Aquabacterium sp.]
MRTEHPEHAAALPPRPQLRVLIIPGLHDSGEGHWQTWLQAHYPRAVRVVQNDWHTPDLDAWAASIDATVQDPRHDQVQWVAVAHSFGCLALAHHLAHASPRHGIDGHGDRDGHSGHVCAALMVAPADPVKFQIEDRLPRHPLGIPLNLIGSENDPWMPLSRARHWAMQWRAVFQSLGAAGHINVASGFGPWPLARHKVDHMLRLQDKQLRLAGPREDARPVSA